MPYIPYLPKDDIIKPDEMKGDITKFKACYAKLGGDTGNQIQIHPNAPKRATRASPVP